MGDVLDDIHPMFDWYNSIVMSEMCFGVTAFMFESLTFFFGCLKLWHKKYNVEDDIVSLYKYDSEVIMNNNPGRILFTLEGNPLLVYNKRVSDTACSP